MKRRRCAMMDDDGWMGRRERHEKARRSQRPTISLSLSLSPQLDASREWPGHVLRWLAAPYLPAIKEALHRRNSQQLREKVEQRADGSLAFIHRWLSTTDDDVSAAWKPGKQGLSEASAACHDADSVTTAVDN
ncbi:hypothetical protein TRV_06646 [Trichophyton verrucosum HKI 0517]|uniref:Uncharacterized protein n=1 Tax=Trichophyton verrucosum (strain HKI 0517) TaxID=663202 RepID=D4DHJ0_TRIVH|nr:uncharacterized protein TRV_06646 [Trichophyton verrucosum HKI 0517]EFE38657.1 hypothetical protein TRV_06646 [Trichophyton verrucosum HKI 0517]